MLSGSRQVSTRIAVAEYCIYGTTEAGGLAIADPTGNFSLRAEGISLGTMIRLAQSTLAGVRTLEYIPFPNLPQTAMWLSAEIAEMVERP